MSYYSNLKAAAPSDTQALMEIFIQTVGPDPGMVAAFCRRIGCSFDEAKQIATTYNNAIMKNTRPPYPELF